MVITLRLLSKKYLTSLYPGSETKGDPASDIKAIAEFFTFFDTIFIIFSSL